MSTTSITTSTSTTTAPSGVRWLDSHRATGAAGLGFAATVIVQNAIRGSAPQVQASVTEITEYYEQHRAAEWTLIALFVIGAVCLARFVGGLWSRLEREGEPSRRWARAGVLGAAGILSLFTVLVAAEIALIVGTDDPELASTIAPMWLLHNAVFSVLTVFIALALFGFGRASTSAGLITPVVAKMATAGAALLAVSTVLAPITVDHFSAASLVGPIGFVGWLSFVISVSRRLRRD